LQENVLKTIFPVFFSTISQLAYTGMKVSTHVSELNLIHNSSIIIILFLVLTIIVMLYILLLYSTQAYINICKQIVSSGNNYKIVMNICLWPHVQMALLYWI